MYLAKEDRYEHMNYFRCGNSRLKLPAVSLGLWHNFGSKDNYDNMKQLVFTGFRITGLPILIWRIIMGLFTEARRRISEGSWKVKCALTATRW